MAGFLEHKLGLSSLPLRCLSHFIWLAATLLCVDVLAMTLAESLFLTNVGAERLPVFYVLLAGVSIPVASGFSYLVDRVPRLRLFHGLLLGSLVLALLLRWMASRAMLTGYFALYIGFSVVELLMEIQFWVLVSDYFTSLELKRAAPLLLAAMSGGGLLGGATASLLVEAFTPTNLLWAVPPFYLLAMAQLTWLGRAQQPLEAAEAEEEQAGVWESLKSFPPLIRRHPIIWMLALSALLVPFLRCVAEFQVFSIYEQRFPEEQELAGFLGLLSGTLSVLEFAVLLFFTRPLIQKLGVHRMNLIYPATTLASFAGLAISYQVPAAIAANINYETLGNSVAAPVDTLNYNAIPRRFLGRVRGVIDGLSYPLGMALAGALLWVGQSVLDSLETTLSALLLTAGLLALGHGVGRHYLTSLVEMLRSRSVNLDDVGEGLAKLPPRYADEVRRLLTSPDRNAQILGVELAARMNPAEFLPELQALLPAADARLRRSLVRLYAAFRPEDLAGRMPSLLESEEESLRELALELAVAVPALRQQGLDRERLAALLDDPSPVVRGLACVVVPLVGVRDEALEAACAVVLEQPLGPTAHLAMIQAVRSAADPALLPLLRRILERAAPTVQDDALDALAVLLDRGAPAEGLEAVAADFLTHPEAPVRAAAAKLLGRIRTATAAARLGPRLEDTSQSVREQAATALAACGELALQVAEPYLTSPRAEVVDAAISAIGGVRSPRAEERLFRFLQADFRQVRNNLAWLPLLPADGIWQPLRIAIEDSNLRITQRVLHVLSALGHRRTLNCVRRILFSTDERARADAVETMASLSHRRFVEPILPLLEAQATAQHRRNDPQHNPARPRAVAASELRHIAEQAAVSADRWVRVGGILALAASPGPIPGALLREPADPLVRDALLHTLIRKGAQQGRPGTEDSDTAHTGGATLWNRSLFMNRVLFLKNVPLFKFLSLDDLLIVDQALVQKEYLAGEVIFREGQPGSDLCIITAGRVEIRKHVHPREHVLAELGPGECFGEMALFDDAPRSATAVAVSDATLLTLERSRFLSLTAQRPEIALEVCKVLSLRLREANEQLGKLAAEAGLAGAGHDGPTLS
ncbi:MAG: cyclic nucleotide-binding domain-containing protein [Firmicutes bacterium]|nr:cyclic nucleotide-binding domain-containing protein [Bacillota bacterium]